MAGDFNNDFNNDFSGASGGPTPLVVYYFTNPPPNTGLYAYGQIAINSAPSVGQPLMWVNISSINPPNWIPMLNKSITVTNLLSVIETYITTNVKPNKQGAITGSIIQMALTDLVTALTDIENGA